MSAPDFALVIGGFNHDCRNLVDKHYLAYHAVHLSVGGAFSLAIGTRRWELEAPCLWTGYPGPRVRFSPIASASGPWQDYYFGVAGGLPRRWLAEGLLPRGPRRVARLEEARAAATELTGMVGASGGVRGRLAANLMERLLLLVDDERRAPEEPAWLAALIRRVAAEPAWQPDWDLVARDCGLPPSTFRKRFRATTGRPPQRWLIERRVAVARELLGSGLAVTAVAERLGYTDPFFFSRQFRAWAGIAPSAFARGEGG